MHMSVATFLVHIEDSGDSSFVCLLLSIVHFCSNEVNLSTTKAKATKVVAFHIKLLKTVLRTKLPTKITITSL